MMFNNLIESSSHRKEYRRRGWFFLLTTATYAFMLVVTGIASIYAYDAHLEDQTYQEVITLLPLPEQPPTIPASPVRSDRPRGDDNNRSTIPERQVAMLDVNRPDVPPERVSADPNPVRPLPPGLVHITNRDWDPPTAGGGGGNTTGGGTRIVPPTTVVLPDTLPPPPQPPVNKVVRSSKVLNSEAIYLPKPNYPALARQIRLQGAVNVQVLIDETGKVISAKAVSGHPMLVDASTRAAMQARFTPTKIGEQPVKVSGVIIYNFVLGQ